MDKKKVISPQTACEHLLYSTVRLVGIKNSQNICVGTGFFYSIKLDNEKEIQLILTNKHVVDQCDHVEFFLHETVDGINPSGDSFKIALKKEDVWTPHPDPQVDLGALNFSCVREVTKQKLNKRIFNRSLSEKLILTDSQLMEQSSVAEEILMIGYPTGLWDDHNNFPIVRKGITATHPAVDHQNNSVGVADIACFPGSSGSPILVCLDGSFPSKTGGIVLGSKRILLGLLYAGPQYTSAGEIKIQEVSTSDSQLVPFQQQMMHLGYYIKAKEILILSDVIKELYSAAQNQVLSVQP